MVTSYTKEERQWGRSCMSVFRPNTKLKYACWVLLLFTRGFPFDVSRAQKSFVSFPELADLMPDVQALQQSAYSSLIPLFQAQCALEENCFPPSVYNLISRNQKLAYMHMRRLLRFSSIIHNVGTDVFRPHEPKERWVWHACHMWVPSVFLCTYPYEYVTLQRTNQSAWDDTTNFAVTAAHHVCVPEVFLSSIYPTYCYRVCMRRWVFYSNSQEQEIWLSPPPSFSSSMHPSRSP